MSSDTSSWIFVDDQDPGIAYGIPPGGLLWRGGVAQEYNHTTTGLYTGDTLTYYFNASRIAIFGTYGPPGELGPPIAVYQVDDAPTVTVTAPITLATVLYRQNLWTSDSLPSPAPGAFHRLFINQTAPNNTLWIDYLAYPPASSGVTVTSAGNGSTTLGNLTPTTAYPPTNSGVTGTSAGDGSTTLGRPTPTISFTITSTSTVSGQSGASRSKTNVSAIVASVVVGTVVLILASFALVYVWRRRSRSSAREYLIQGENGTSPDTSQNPLTSLTRSGSVTPHRPLSESAPSYTTVPQQERPRDQLPRPLPMVPGSVRTLDGGVRLMGGPLEIPPEYQEHY